MRHYYALYGQCLRVDRRLPGLVAVEQPVSPTIEIYFQDVPIQEPSWSVIAQAQDPGTALFTRSIWISPRGAYHQIQYEDNLGSTAYTLAPDGRTIWIALTENVIQEEAIACLLTQIVARALRIQGVLCLHAGVVTVGDRAIALVGHRGAGKSTTTAALARRGFPVLADDMAVLHLEDRVVRVHPGLPYLRLRPDAAAHLYGTSEAVPALWVHDAQRIDKRRLDLHRHGLGFATRALPLAAIYLLETDQAATAPTVLPLGAAAAFSHLAPHPYVSDVLDAAGRAREFQQMSQLVRSVPVKRLRRPPSLNALPQICEAILEDAHDLSVSA